MLTYNFGLLEMTRDTTEANVSEKCQCVIVKYFCFLLFTITPCE